MPDNRLREVRLYGHLGERYGRVHRFAVRSVGEAVRALMANFPTFEADLIGSDPRETRYRVWFGARRLGREDLQLGGSGVIRIAPALSGAKSRGTFQIVLGIVLIAAGVLINYSTYGAGSPLGNALISAGVALVLGGVIQLLMPLPKADKPRDDPASSYFDGPVQTGSQGSAVPVLYGELYIGSVVISAGIDVEQVPVELPESKYGFGMMIPE